MSDLCSMDILKLGILCGMKGAIQITAPYAPVPVTLISRSTVEERKGRGKSNGL